MSEKTKLDTPRSDSSLENIRLSRRVFKDPKIQERFEYLIRTRNDFGKIIVKKK